MSQSLSRAEVLAQKQAVDLKQAADYLGICVKSVRRRIADGDLPAFKIRGTRSIRVYLHDLDAMKQPVGGGAV